MKTPTVKLIAYENAKTSFHPKRAPKTSRNKFQAYLLVGVKLWRERLAALHRHLAVVDAGHVSLDGYGSN